MVRTWWNRLRCLHKYGTAGIALVALLISVGCGGESSRRPVSGTGWSQEVESLGGRVTFLFVLRGQRAIVGLVARGGPIYAEIGGCEEYAEIEGLRVDLPERSDYVYAWDSRDKVFVPTQVLAQPLLDKGMRQLREDSAPPFSIDVPEELIKTLGKTIE